jgi:hypothetical protein
VTDNMLRVLRAMAAAEEAGEWEDGELVSAGGRQWWLGLDVVAARTVDRLLACRAVSDRSEGAATLRLGLNGTGMAIIAIPVPSPRRSWRRSARAAASMTADGPSNRRTSAESLHEIVDNLPHSGLDALIFVARIQ